MPTERKKLFKSLDLGGERIHVEDIKSCCDYDRRLKTQLVTQLEWWLSHSLPLKITFSAMLASLLIFGEREMI